MLIHNWEGRLRGGMPHMAIRAFQRWVDPELVLVTRPRSESEPPPHPPLKGSLNRLAELVFEQIFKQIFGFSGMSDFATPIEDPC